VPAAESEQRRRGCGIFFNKKMLKITTISVADPKLFDADPKDLFFKKMDPAPASELY
jgi:hypothetical protein